ncbi:MAG TPA: TIM barrel protein [Thermomicrobiaceae bacterium]|nr:TIM barrel protein [Thermomicrobiaceae bacterium]
MTVLLGNSGSPRWYMGEPERLERYLDHLRDWGATSTEMVLHHGPSDERTARVHVLRPDWEPMFQRYRDAGMAIQFHVSLDPRFATDRWAEDPDGLRAEYRPLLDAVGEVAADQGRTVLVLHGAGDPRRNREANQTATAGLLRWLADESERLPGDVHAAVELGAAKQHRPTAVGRSRAGVLDLVDDVGSPRVGICWDVAHDRENADREPDWTPVPCERFLRHVAHVHLHDLDDEGEAHYPLVCGRVPYPEQLAALASVDNLPSVTMEIRWRCAARLGEPWDLLGESYRAAERAMRAAANGSV